MQKLKKKYGKSLFENFDLIRASVTVKVYKIWTNIVLHYFLHDYCIKCQHWWEFWNPQVKSYLKLSLATKFDQMQADKKSTTWPRWVHSGWSRIWSLKPPLNSLLSACIWSNLAANESFKLLLTWGFQNCHQCWDLMQ